jgi:mono/diheme cytochrome c family protein
MSGVIPRRRARWPLLAVGLGAAGIGVLIAAATPPWIAPAEEAARANPRRADAASLASGREVYRENCATCHGASGKGDGDLADLLDVPVGNLASAEEMAGQSDGALRWKVATGRFPMPAFAGDLDDQRIWDVVNYVRTLSSPPPPARP